MTVSLVTKGMICQGHIIVNTTQRFVLPLTLGLQNKTFDLHIKNSKQEIKLNKSLTLECFVKTQENKINIGNKKIRLHINRICS